MRGCGTGQADRRTGSPTGTADPAAQDTGQLVQAAVAGAQADPSATNRRSPSAFSALPRDDFHTESRDRVLADDELVAVWRAAEKAGGTFGAIVKLLILTGQRREEVAGMEWAELSDDRLTWTIPASRAKNGKAHLVPLSAMARELLPAEPSAEERETELVFPGQRGTRFSGWSKCKAQLDTDSGVTNWRLHDLRRTLATGLQRLGVRLEVTEAVLNHVSGTRAGIVGIYQRHDWAEEKRAALDAWEEHVSRLANKVAID